MEEGNGKSKTGARDEMKVNGEIGDEEMEGKVECGICEGYYITSFTS